MSDKINLHISLLLSVYKSSHQTVKYGHQRNNIYNNITGLEIKISMKSSKAKNRFEPGFQQPKTCLPKNLVLTSLLTTTTCNLTDVCH